MLFSLTSSQQGSGSSQISTSVTQKIRGVASNILLKLKLSKNKDYIKLDDQGATEVQVARFVTFNRAEAPQIIDLKAMRHTIRPQPYIYHQTRVPCSQADLKQPELRLQTSFESLNGRKPTQTGTPLRRNPQQAFVFDATMDRSAAAALDDIADYLGYEILDDDEDTDVDWTLLDLPEHIYARLANDSRHSLIALD